MRKSITDKFQDDIRRRNVFLKTKQCRSSSLSYYIHYKIIILWYQKVEWLLPLINTGVLILSEVLVGVLQSLALVLWGYHHQLNWKCSPFLFSKIKFQREAVLFLLGYLLVNTYTACRHKLNIFNKCSVRYFWRTYGENILPC